ncbi:hypothetical protein LY76DRAFT_593372 [Colletotrichum caudatum]|nr:hypothetical protein LY76DRAFT_593372 [Colletotrichum caudatum]
MPDPRGTVRTYLSTATYYCLLRMYVGTRTYWRPAPRATVLTRYEAKGRSLPYPRAAAPVARQTDQFRLRLQVRSLRATHPGLIWGGGGAVLTVAHANGKTRALVPDGYCQPGSGRDWNRCVHVTRQGPTKCTPLWHASRATCGGDGGNRGNRAPRYLKRNWSGQMGVPLDRLDAMYK